MERLLIIATVIMFSLVFLRMLTKDKPKKTRKCRHKSYQHLPKYMCCDMVHGKCQNCDLFY